MITRDELPPGVSKNTADQAILLAETMAAIKAVLPDSIEGIAYDFATGRLGKPCTCRDFAQRDPD